MSALLSLAAGPIAPAQGAEGKHLAEPGTMLSVADFLPNGFVKDGSVSYQADLQKALDSAARQGRALCFPPMVYRVDESGLRLHSNMTLWMYGAVFQLDEHRSKDGQVFAGKDIVHLQVMGGTIAGRNDVWAEGVNIRGFHFTGRSQYLRLRDLHIRDLSSNGVGVFGDPQSLARDVWVIDTVIENCCNRYGDYLSAKPGPEKGSVRQDQGLIAFYHVGNFVVRGCRFDKSRSDGTHFFHCHSGQFVHNQVNAAQMGGYFLETCHDILASDNIFRDNGSRGVTIERGSSHCTLKGCIVANSGREGLWAPDSIALVITGNVFDRNGRKPNGPKPHQLWNANITVNEDPKARTKVPAADYLIADNIIYTTQSQVAAIRVEAAKASGIVIKNNLLRGENVRIQINGSDQ